MGRRSPEPVREDAGGSAFQVIDPAASDRYDAARRVLSGIPMAVVLIGAGNERERSCATGTAMYVSFAPPRLAIALHPGSRTCALVTKSRRFSVSVLDAGDSELAARAGRSSKGVDKFAALDLPVVSGPAGTPALAGAPLIAWCSVVDRRPIGDHELIVGEVEAFDRTGLDAPDSPPAMIRHQRRYAGVGDWLSDEAPEGYPT